MGITQRRNPWLVAALNTASYMGFIPFHVSYSEESELYHIAPVCFPRKLLCAALNFWELYFLWNYFLFHMPTSFFSGTGFSLTLLNISTVLAIFQNSLFMLTYWSRKGQAELLDIIQGTSIPFTKGSVRIHQLISSILSVGMAISFNFMYRHFDNNEVPVDERDILQWSMWGLWNTLSYHSKTYSYCCCTYILVLVALSLHQLSNWACRDLEQTSSLKQIDEGLERYRGLKQLSQQIGTLFGTKILLFYVTGIAYFAKTTEAYAWTAIVRVITLVVYFTLFAIFWLASAELHLNVRNAMQHWTTRLQDREDLTLRMSMRLMAAYNESILDPVGISCKFFTITYGFIGSMTGIIVTYAILMYQFQLGN